MDNISRIASFSVNHDYIIPGIYISRIDGDITTFDLRTRKPNEGDYMDNLTMHSMEHMFATYVRNSEIADRIIYFGPMGCQTGFYLLTRNVEKDKVYDVVISTLKRIITHKGEIFGKVREECGNYMNLDLNCAKEECKKYLTALENNPNRFDYPTK